MKAIRITIASLCVLSMNVFSSKAQWTPFIYYPTPIPPFCFTCIPYFGDADFISQSSCVYSYSYFISNLMGYNVFAGGTADTGYTWNLLQVAGGMNTGTLSVDAIRKENTYYHGIFGVGGSVYAKTLDNGLTWKYAVSPGCGFPYDFFGVDTSHIFVIMDKGICGYPYDEYLYKYEYGYLNAIDSFLSEHPRTIYFPDTSIGYMTACTQLPFGNKHMILKTTTGGDNWSEVFNDSLVSLNSLFFTNDSIGYAAGNFGVILKTMDGGINWQYLFSGITDNLHTVCFVNDSVGFAGGDHGKIVGTIDGGATWIPDSIGSPDRIKKIVFVDSTMAYAVSDDAMGYKKNLGVTPGIWEPLFTQPVSLTIYPNPASDKFQVIIPYNFEEKGEMELFIYDYCGRTAFSTTVPQGSSFINVDLGKGSKGLYFVILSDRHHAVNGKIILE